MACRVQDKTISTIMELLSEQGFEEMRESFEVLLNEITGLERAAYLGAEPYERRGYANDYKPKTV